MTIVIKHINLPTDFATNVLALRGVVDCVKRSNKGGWQSDRCKRTTYPWAIDVVDAVKEAANFDGEVTYWYNINTGDNYNEWHDHDRGATDEICATLYIQVPQGAGAFEYKLKAETKLIIPTEGLLIIFPDDLMHRVLPNDGDGERVSMAFNFWKMLK
jgi:hypothetical protein